MLVVIVEGLDRNFSYLGARVSRNRRESAQNDEDNV